MVDRHHETQEQSIKARKHQLFEADAPAFVGSGRPFKEFLRETPAAPLSGPTKAALWAAGVIVVLVLAATLFKTFSRPPRPAPRPATRAAESREPSGGLDGPALVRWNGGPMIRPATGLTVGGEHDDGLDRIG